MRVILIEMDAIATWISDISRWGIALGSALVALLISGVPVLVVYGFVIWVAYRFGRFVAGRLFKKK